MNVYLKGSSVDGRAAAANVLRIGATTATRSLEQLRTLQRLVNEAATGLIDWDHSFAGMFLPIKSQLEDQIRLLEVATRSAVDCDCLHAPARHDGSGCLEDAKSGSWSYCGCMWPGPLAQVRSGMENADMFDRVVEMALRADHDANRQG